MKKNILLIIGFLCCIAATSEAIEPSFLHQVNAAWKARNEGAILTLATAEIHKTPVNPEGFAVLFGYNVFIAGSYQGCLDNLDQLIVALNATKQVDAAKSVSS